MACVDLPAFPLQLLYRKQPGWRVHPVVVVDADRPQGKVLWANERAQKFNILPGMRYAAALSLSGGLRAACVPEEEVAHGVESILRCLRYFTPEIEPTAGKPGVFWLNATGLEPLFSSLERWARLIHRELAQEGFTSAVVVGAQKFTTFAVARAARGVVVFRNRADEEATARRVPLDRLTVEPAVRETLVKLGIRTVGAFADLPPEGVERRFGKTVYHLHQLARGAVGAPLVPKPAEPVFRKRCVLDYPESDVTRLVFLVEHLLPPLLEELAARQKAVVSVRIVLVCDGAPDHTERIRPAEPTLDSRQLKELIWLRLKAIPLRSGVNEVEVSIDAVRATRKQLALFSELARRDLEAANRALARVRAAFGETAVVRARLRDGHLPEAHFTWERFGRLEKAQPTNVRSGAMVRRIYTLPVGLPARPRHEPDGWILRSLVQGPVVRVLGPYVVSGGWWRQRVHREYHFAETQNGELFWVYYDRFRRRWFIHGRIE